MMYNNNGKMAIFIDSYDGNSDIWENFFQVFNHYWPDCMYQRYLVTNKLEYKENNLICIKTGDNTDWVNCTLNALHAIKEEYILFLLDDYYFSKKISNADFEEIVEQMDKTSTFFYRLSLRQDLDRSPKYQPVYSDFYYAINLQPAIWKKNTFVELLTNAKDSGLKTPWEFEKSCIEILEADKSPKHILEGVLYDTRDLLGYKNAIIQGRWVRKVIQYYNNKTTIKLKLGNRHYMKRIDELFDYIKTKGHKFFDYKRRKQIKKHLSKFGIKFMS